MSSLKFGKYDFQGPYDGARFLFQKPGVVLILCKDIREEARYYVIDIDESEDVRDTAMNHPRQVEWVKNCHGIGKLAIAVLYGEIMSKETIGLLLLTVGGAIATLYYLREAIRGLDSKRWPSTNGTVIASEISSVFYETVTYFPNIKYEYVLESEKYSSRKIAFLNDFSSIGLEPMSNTFQYPVGTHVKVYYHPNKPELSVLSPGFSPNLWVLLRFGIGLLFFILGLSELIG